VISVRHLVAKSWLSRELVTVELIMASILFLSIAPQLPPEDTTNGLDDKSRVLQVSDSAGPDYLDHCVSMSGNHISNTTVHHQATVLETVVYEAL
jgi:hypothetical protein